MLSSSALFLRRAGRKAATATRAPSFSLRSPIARRLFNNSSSSSAGRVHVRSTPFEATFGQRAPMSAQAKLGWTAALTGSAIGMGTLYYYGNSLQSEAGQNAALASSIASQSYLPEYARQRLRHTWAYVGGGLALTAATATVALRSGAALRWAGVSPWVSLGVGLVGMLGSTYLTQSIDYHESPVAKHVAWGTSMAISGLVLSPITFLGGAVMLKAAVATGCLVGSLALLGASAPSESFLWMGGPLMAGFGLVAAASIGSMFLPASPLLHNVVMYGGLAVFSGMMLYDQQRMMQAAEHAPVAQYDPINLSYGVYYNALNIFIRMAQIFASSSGNKRR